MHDPQAYLTLELEEEEGAVRGEAASRVVDSMVVL